MILKCFYSKNNLHIIYVRNPFLILHEYIYIYKENVVVYSRYNFIDSSNNRLVPVEFSSVHPW
jgi:hypothetical protein